MFVCAALTLASRVGYVCKMCPKGEAAMKCEKGEAKGQLGSHSASANQTTLRSLHCQVQDAEYREVAAALLDYHKETLEKQALESLEQIVREKPKFGYWTISDTEYDQEYSLAMDLGRLRVFRGNVSADRDEYRLAHRLNRDHPTLVGLNRFDYRRQFVVFLSPKAWALRRFALVEMARHHSQVRTILFD